MYCINAKDEEKVLKSARKEKEENKKNYKEPRIRFLIGNVESSQIFKIL